MSHAKRLAVFAGATIGFGSVVCAQSSDLSSAYAADLLNDSMTRKSLLGTSNSTVTPFGQIQFRYLWNNRDDDTLDNDAATGFQTRRTKVGVKGKVNDEWKFKVNGAFERDDGLFVLEDAYVDYHINDNWTIRFGQFKLPTLREESISSSQQQAADRSIMNELFNQDRSQGVMFSYAAADSGFRFSGALSDGLRTANSDFTSMAEADFALTGRFDWMFQGEDASVFDDFEGWTGQNGDEIVGNVGVAGHWQSGGETVGTADTDNWQLTVDAQVEGSGWSVFGAFVWDHADPEGGTESDNWGAVVQGGFFLQENWEAFARWDGIFADDDTGADDFSTITVGINHFFIPNSHAAKFTADVQLFLDEQAASLAPASTGTGLLASSQDSQIALRLQMQLLF